LVILEREMGASATYNPPAGRRRMGVTGDDLDDK
jgi:hypothetical protein